MPECLDFQVGDDWLFLWSAMHLKPQLRKELEISSGQTPSRAIPGVHRDGLMATMEMTLVKCKKNV